MFNETAFTDASEQEKSLPGWDQEYRQLSPGPFEGKVTMLQFPGLTIIRERMNAAVEQHYTSPDSSLIFFGQSAGSSSARVDGQVYGGKTIGFGHRWQEQLSVTGPMSDHLMAVVELSDLPERAPVRTGLLHGPAAAQADGVCQWLNTLLELYNSGTDSLPEQLDGLLPEMIRDRLSLLQESTVPQQPQADPQHQADLRIYRRMEEWLKDNPREPISVTALSRELHLPSRTLRAACQRIIGYRLDDVLLIRRLNYARRDLIAARNAPRRVSDIALDWGFFHWGRFSTRYRAMFGETPSQTMQVRS
ncbi:MULTISPECIES: helix-turn-helix domain-containing protein [Alphaproteobacteria]|uniref:AraC family transcriptional regulator n=2 Tax=Alphaproteobacteria TaxID=28211 RepID=A0A512HF99_9HYPH|nr:MULTISPECIES: helix-turn-helix domain-containing protein [Alphaproteobacteria]GEO84118.1 AraC family transcriptional regulator [Ciceribacter naphthalenivorans]GLR24654.1 AraC family transcriptional regulator [Ciceribacter naphthalenivorans]GLT07510.1 AraC family transcriptional regulator [Sphingomonas psychrolutea]